MHTHTTITDPQRRHELFLLARDLRNTPTTSLTPRQKNVVVRSCVRTRAENVRKAIWWE